MPDDAPIVVVGGGPAGSATAILLARRGQRVVLLDSAQFPRRKACAEYISPGGAAILRSLGVDLDTHGRWLRGMDIRAPSGACHVVTYGAPFRGLSMARTELDTRLVELAQAAGVEVRQGCRVRGVVMDGRRAIGVRLADGSELAARVVVGADGLHSVVARAVSRVRAARWPRRLGLVAHYRDVPWPADVGQMWVGHHGYVGVAPLDHDGRLTVGLVQPLGKRPPLPFERALDGYPELAARLARGQREASIIGVGPLARRVERCAGAGYALVGDAAGFFDPFTGEGIFRALRGAQLAAAALECGGPADYARQRRRAFAAKERLTALIAVFVQVPALLELAIRRLQQRPRVALRLGRMLGDLEPTDLGVVGQLLRP